MAMMSIEHPDILKFLHAKEDLQAFVNFNVSLKVSDVWMKKTEKSPKSFHVVTNFRTGQRYLLPKKIDIENYSINDLHKLSGKALPKTGNFYSVGEIWKMIIKCAHNTGEPGLSFIDRINDENPTPDLGEIEATNPCGEQPLLAYEACTLGSINLSRFVEGRSGKADMDMDGLKEAVELGVRFLDNIVDACKYPTLDTTKIAQANRKIGLGVMGFADCLFKLGIKYDSEQGVEFGESIMNFVNNAARQASGKLADMRGPFPNWNQSIWRTRKNLKVRNAAITCIAPTGTISIIANCSCGIEPIYSLVFKRQILDGTKMVQVNDVFKEAAEKAGIYNKQLEAKIARSGSIAKMTTVPAGLRRVFRCAYDVKPEWHIKMQAAFQGYCDAAVSKTVNFEKASTAAAVEKAYKLAYKSGCKGITIYRAGSREQEPMCLY